MKQQVLTANLLAGGLVVFLTRDGRFVGDIDAAAIAAGTAEAARFEETAAAAKASNQIVDPYLIEVARDATGAIRPVKFREWLRAKGPSVRPDLGYQAHNTEPKCA